MDNQPVPSVNTSPALQRVPVPCLLPLRNLLDDWDADAKARHAAKTSGEALGPTTGLPRLDTALGQHLSPGLHILHGVPGVGKTAFALQLAALCGCPALYISCEMTALELLRRITARCTGTYLGKFKSGELLPDYSRQLVRQAVAATPHLALADATRTPITSEHIFEFAEATRNLDGSSPHLLIVVDSLHSWVEGIGQSLPEYEALNAGLAALRGLAARLNCPVLAVAERNRASMSGGGLSAGAGSRKIEYGAETVIDLDTGNDTPEGADGEKPVTLHLRKNRNGVAGKSIQLKFHGALQRYSEAAQ